MYRVLAIIGGGLALAACTSSSSDWMNLDALKPKPLLDTVQLESQPPGAEAKASSGQTCRTPCSLALPTNAPLTVTFTLNGYLPETEKLDVVEQTGSPPTLRPNPVLVELTAAPPPKPVKKPVRKKRTSVKKPAVKKPATASAPAAAPPAQPQQQAPAPWPAPPQQR